MKIIDLSQGSPGWLTWRSAGLGASDANLLVSGKHFERTLKDLWEEKVRTVVEKLPPARKPHSNSAMARGQRLEPEARLRYEKWLGRPARPLCAVHETFPWLKASLDGWIDDLQLILEIKAPNRNAHELALANGVPEYYIPQLWHQLLVTGGKAVHYVSYSPYFHGLEQMAVVTFRRDEDQIQTYLALATQFWQLVLSRTPPPERLSA